MPFIEVKDLSKSFLVSRRAKGLQGAFAGLFKRDRLEVHALDRVSFSIERGELLGYIGPNGAGKSTTVKILSGILIPESGSCEVDGLVPWKNRIPHVRRIGVVFGQRTQLWWDLPVEESFDLLRDIYRIPEDDYRRNRDQLVEMFELGSILSVPVRQLSLGQRMRCDFAAALLHDPEILFLDEPTIGLDAVAKLAVRDFIRKINRERGTTIILTTHDMDDIETLCSRVIVIGEGSILYDGALGELRKKQSGEKLLTVDFHRHVDEITLELPDTVQCSSLHQYRGVFRYDASIVDAANVISLISEQETIRDMTVENPPIEELIAGLYRSMEGSHG